jgi:hypothetical protein
MMKHELAKQIAAEVGYRLRDTHVVGITKLENVNNGPVMVISVEEESGHGITFEVDSLCEAVLRGTTISNIAEQMVAIVMHDISQGVDAMSSFIKDFGNIKNQLKAVLVNSEFNAEFLKDKPHFDILDLSIVYRIEFQCDVNRVAGVYVTDDLFDEWHIEANVLHETAMQNTKTKYPVLIKPMFSVLTEILGTPDLLLQGQGEAIYDLLVISNEDMRFGAIHMVDKGVLYESSKLLMTNKLYILPSSVHEVIVCRADSINKNYAMHMVKDINVQFVDTKDVLSNNIYLFDAEMGQIIIL